jgi:uncharacterized protein (DUF4415 family)
LKKAKKKKMSDGEVNAIIEAAALAKPHKVKVQLSIRLDSDVFMELRKRAAQGAGGGKYQRLLNDILRTVLFEIQEPNELDSRHMAKQLLELSKRVDGLQRKLTDKKRRRA